MHEAGECHQFPPYDEMPVIWHHAIRKKPKRDFSDGLGENRFKRLVILCVVEEALARRERLDVDNMPGVLLNAPRHWASTQLSTPLNSRTRCRSDAGLMKYPDQVSNEILPTPGPNRRLGMLIRAGAAIFRRRSTLSPRTRLDATIAIVISNQENAGGLDRARRAGIETLTISHRGWPARDDYDRALVAELRNGM